MAPPRPGTRRRGQSMKNVNSEPFGGAQMQDQVATTCDLTPEQRRRARQNWGKLRDHIKNMRNKANWLVVWLDERNEKEQ
mmetsp:Transcript_5086/g.7730  ORF Transcript_5086/g.7730 Transcript_5086/m.7730 type:complete len:80 (+) Transcript_5086:312-551(+)